MANMVYAYEKTLNDSLFIFAIELATNHQYEEAEKICVRIIEKNPEHPAGYFFKAAILQSKMMDFETELWIKDFRYYINLTIKFADKNIKQLGKSDLHLMFYKASALCYLAFYDGRKGNYLSAINHGVRGISLLKKIVKLKPNYYDAYFGIGSYKYWRSKITSFLNWLPLISDERKSGIQMVKRAIEQGRLTKYAAMSELTWRLLDANKPDQAFECAKRGLNIFPQSRFLLWGAAKSAYVSKQYKTALSYYQKLLQSITNSYPNNHYNEYICRLKLARINFKIKNYPSVQQQLKILDSLTLSSDIADRLARQQKEKKQLKKQLSKIIKTSQPMD